MKRKLVAFLLPFLFFLLPPTMHADEGWRINDFKSDIAIQESGEVRIVETIQVDFQNLSKHGIFRDIPFVYESNGQKTYTEIVVEDVLQNDRKAKYETSRDDYNIRIKIGDPDKTITGKNMYVITYRAKGVLRSFADHDELYWNVTGNNWPVIIDNAEAVVTLPKPQITKIACFEGYEGSKVECNAQIAAPQLAQFSSTTWLADTQGITAVVGYTKGLVPILTVERPKEFWEKFIEWPSLTTLAIGLLAGIGTIFFLWNKYGRDYWFAQNIFGKKEDLGVKKPIGAHETITVEFTPPEKLRPAEIGVLMDEQADTHDVVATIIDLATRGFLSITEIPKKWMFGSIDYELKRKEKDASDLLGYENLLLAKLFENRESVKISSLKKTFYDELAQVKKALYKEVIDKKLFSSDPEHTRSTYVAIAIVAIVLGGFMIGPSIEADFVFGADIGLGIVICGTILLGMAKFMPRRTAYGREMYRRIRGYRLFIDKAEKYRQQFFEKRNMFNEVLPYAITFGLTEKFAKQMHDMGVHPTQTGWYSGSHPITSPHFSSSMSGFSKSLGTAIASTPSSSGGFSGGGSSGGGFGGGGGGSW